MNSVPSVTSFDTFGDFNVEEIQLIVPQGVTDAYRATEGWKDFNIEEMP